MPPSIPTPALPDRPDTILAAVIDVAIELMNEEGRHKAAERLTDAGASLATIGRVLCDQTRRHSKK